MNMQHGFIIGAPSSGTGKTTVTLGVMRALADRNISVAPFKTGPDYIDTQYHAVACRRPSVNLDTFFTPGDGVARLFSRYVAPGDTAVVEGAMGLFDGYNRDCGSTADVARRLQLPVVLVVSAKSVSYSLAPLLSGFRNFDPGVHIAGVIFNRVGSPRHKKMIEVAAADAGIDVFGEIPLSASLTLPSRHLGLSLNEREEMETFVADAARIVADNVDLCRISSLTGGPFRELSISADTDVSSRRLTVAVARDMAFNFLYPTTIDSLSAIGDVCYFSPLANEPLPPDTDIVYLPGGYPELYAARLSAATTTMTSIREFVAKSGRVLAECGGLIYLCSAIECDGNSYPMCGVFPMTATMENARLCLGYRIVEVDDMTLRGHEFHYSHLVGDDTSVRTSTDIYDAMGNRVDTALYRVGNVIAGYTHMYWGDTDITKLWNR